LFLLALFNFFFFPHGFLSQLCLLPPVESINYPFSAFSALVYCHEGVPTISFFFQFPFFFFLLLLCVSAIFPEKTTWAGHGPSPIFRPSFTTPGSFFLPWRVVELGRHTCFVDGNWEFPLSPPYPSRSPFAVPLAFSLSFFVWMTTCK